MLAHARSAASRATSVLRCAGAATQAQGAAAAASAAETAAAASGTALERFRDRLASGPDFGAFISGTKLSDPEYAVQAPPLKVRARAGRRHVRAAF